jgi:hypothetical protein
LGEEHRLRVFENRVLRRIFGPEREEDRSWRKLHNNELHNLYSSQNIVRVIKSRKTRGRNMWHAWARVEVFTGFWLGGPKERDHWEDLGVSGRITLSWSLGRWGSMGRTGFRWLKIGSSGGRFYKESRLLFDKLSDYQLFK